jgi:hypothetical protein
MSGLPETQLSEAVARPGVAIHLQHLWMAKGINMSAGADHLSWQWIGIRRHLPGAWAVLSTSPILPQEIDKKPSASQVCC